MEGNSLECPHSDQPPGKAGKQVLNTEPGDVGLIPAGLLVSCVA